MYDKFFNTYNTDYLDVIPKMYLEPSRTLRSNMYDRAFLWKSVNG